MAQTYLKNGYVLSMDANDTVYDGGGVLVEDDKIVAIGKVDPALVKPDAEVIELGGKYVLPGFVNTHVHTSHTHTRSIHPTQSRLLPHHRGVLLVPLGHLSPSRLLLV